MKLFSLFSLPAKTVGCSALVALSLGWASQAHAQAYPTYSTDFNSDMPNSTLDGQDGWTINDANEPDLVSVNGSYSASAGDYVAAVGGQSSADPNAAPSTSPVYLTHGFTPVSSQYAFDADFAVTNSTTAFPAVNAFAFTFQQVTGGTTTMGVTTGATYNNLFSIDFVPNGTTNTTATKDLIKYSTYSASLFPGAAQGQTQTSTGLFSTLNSRYHLSLTVNEVTNTLVFSIYDENLSGTVRNGPDYTSPSIALNTLNPGSLINSFSATYLNGQSIQPGSNGLFFDNISAVPEPSTYAMLGMGLAGLAVIFRRKARA